MPNTTKEDVAAAFNLEDQKQQNLMLVALMQELVKLEKLASSGQGVFEEIWARVELLQEGIREIKVARANQQRVRSELFSKLVSEFPLAEFEALRRK